MMFFILQYFMNLYGDFLKILMEILGPYVLRDGSTFAILKSQAFQTFAAVKHYHHQVLTLFSAQSYGYASY